MGKVVFKKLKNSKKHVTTKRVRNANGAMISFRVVDATSRTLPSDIRYVFSKNVLKARKDNKQRLGTSDLVPPSA